MFVSDTGLFSVCTATVVPVVIREMFTVMPSGGRSWPRQASANGRAARAEAAYRSVRYCGTTSPANAAEPAARVSCSPRSTRSSDMWRTMRSRASKSLKPSTVPRTTSARNALPFGSDSGL